MLLIIIINDFQDYWFDTPECLSSLDCCPLLVNYSTPLSQVNQLIGSELPIRFDIMAFALDNQKCVTVLIEPLSNYHSANYFQFVLSTNIYQICCVLTIKPRNPLKKNWRIEQTVLHGKGKGEKLASQSHCNALLKPLFICQESFL